MVKFELFFKQSKLLSRVEDVMFQLPPRIALLNNLMSLGLGALDVGMQLLCTPYPAIYIWCNGSAPSADVILSYC